ncbi:MAG: YkgJ family cysteine cluster protein [Deltaproteobacteria bacterium]|nr:YkgJ family cysteine cluster protein [Deltaproteobacteria bacterium]
MKIEDLYDTLPEFSCPGGCTACCRNFGIPSQTKVEAARIQQFLRAGRRRTGKARGTTCPYVVPEGCTIYPVRPLICRLYGVSPDYLCAEGVRPLRLLHEDEEAELWQLYRENFF